MLFKQRFLLKIEKGEVKIAFRKWSRPTVREGGTLLTPVGQLRIKRLTRVEEDQISASEIAAAGYEHPGELHKEFAGKDRGDIYKIVFELERADPRIELRETTTISAEEMDEIIAQLRKYDARGPVAHWTRRVLELVASDPGRYAVEYSSTLAVEKAWFKVNIRKLKNMGLTISLSDGYEISPRGSVVLDELKKRTKP